VQIQNEQVKQLGPRWTREILRRCSPKEILVLVGVYGIPAIAKRLGHEDIAEFFEKYTKGRS
jgi:hypothetical protein